MNPQSDIIIRWSKCTSLTGRQASCFHVHGLRGYTYEVLERYNVSGTCLVSFVYW